MDPITAITAANALIDLIIRLVMTINTPDAENITAGLLKSKAELDRVGKLVADQKVTY
ncbi:hypothetical protein LCGC14_2601390 [marine sediment metagenome]|uniref:Uncharacterized protein n=1 Tax=marine sediment metagenome TaxID=412755 RepID=A0A0F9CJM3_9ZZZZ